MKRLFLIIAFWAAGVAGASAQMRLTLPQALDLALSENPTVKVAEMEVQRYDYVKRQTWGNLLPQISASGSYTRSIVKSEMRGGISFGADNTFAVQGDLSLPLFAPAIASGERLWQARSVSGSRRRAAAPWSWRCRGKNC